MKKYLLGTTALVAAGMMGMAGGAQAQPKPVQVSVGGYNSQWVSWTNQSNIFGGGNGKEVHVDQQNESEIIFNGRTTLENGITFGFQVQLEAATEGDQIDEFYMFIEGKFGRFELGSINNVAYRMKYAAPDSFTRGSLNEGNVWNFIQNPTNSPFFNSQINMTGLRFFDNDSDKVNYYTPRFAGFQLGVSYIPDSSQDNTDVINRNTGAGGANAGYQRGFAAGVNYVRTFGEWNVAASLGYMHWNAPDNVVAPDPDAYSAGVQIGYGGFKIGGGWSKVSGGRVMGAGTAAKPTFANARRLDGYSWDAGVQYVFGPASVSLNYFYGKNDSNLVTSSLNSDDKLTTVALNGKYTIGPGVSLEATAFHGEIEAGTGNPGAVSGRATSKNSFTGVVAGVVLVF